MSINQTRFSVCNKLGSVFVWPWCSAPVRAWGPCWRVQRWQLSGAWAWTLFSLRCLLAMLLCAPGLTRKKCNNDNIYRCLSQFAYHEYTLHSYLMLVILKMVYSWGEFHFKCLIVLSTHYRLKIFSRYCKGRDNTAEIRAQLQFHA